MSVPLVTICQLVADGPCLRAGAIRGDCARCGRAIWLDLEAARRLRRFAPQLEAMCPRCYEGAKAAYRASRAAGGVT